MKTAENYLVERVEKLEAENKELKNRQQRMLENELSLSYRYERIIRFLYNLGFDYDYNSLHIDNSYISSRKYQNTEAIFVMNEIMVLYPEEPAEDEEENEEE